MCEVRKGIPVFGEIREIDVVTVNVEKLIIGEKKNENNNILVEVVFEIL